MAVTTIGTFAGYHLPKDCGIVAGKIQGRTVVMDEEDAEKLIDELHRAIEEAESKKP